MARKSYYEKLLDPRWQKKRLEILNRDEFKCRSCGDDKSTLHVHHGYYSEELTRGNTTTTRCIRFAMSATNLSKGF